MTKRLFLAINPPNEIKQQLAELVIKLEKNNKNKPIKWVKKDNFHLTLHFLGDTPEDKILNLNKTLIPIISEFSDLNFKLKSAMDAFPDINNPKVIFLEINELNHGQIYKLKQQTDKALEKLGFTDDYRPFRLHLTLGRVKFKTSLQIPNFQLQITDFSISSIDLMASELTPTGPNYTIIQKYYLNKV